MKHLLYILLALFASSAFAQAPMSSMTKTDSGSVITQFKDSTSMSLGAMNGPNYGPYVVSSNATIASGQFVMRAAVHVPAGVTLTVNGILLTYQLSGAGTVDGTGTIVGF